MLSFFYCTGYSLDTALRAGSGLLAAGPAKLCCMGAAAAFVCLGAAAFVTVLYQLAGTMLGGIMLLFLMITAEHFLSGGFLPMVFLPVSVQAAGALPSVFGSDGWSPYDCHRLL